MTAHLPSLNQNHPVSIHSQSQHRIEVETHEANFLPPLRTPTTPDTMLCTTLTTLEVNANRPTRKTTSVKRGEERTGLNRFRRD